MFLFRHLIFETDRLGVEVLVAAHGLYRHLWNILTTVVTIVYEKRSLDFLRAIDVQKSSEIGYSGKRINALRISLIKVHGGYATAILVMRSHIEKEGLFLTHCVDRAMSQLMVSFKHGDLLSTIASFVLLHGRVEIDHILLVIRILVRRARGADRCPVRVQVPRRRAMLALTRLESLLSLGLILLRVLIKLKIDLGRVPNVVDLVINLNGRAIVESVAVLRRRLLASNKKLLPTGADIAM